MSAPTRIPDFIRRFSVLDRAVLAGPGGGDERLRAAAGDRRRIAQRVAEPAGFAVAAGQQTYRQGVRRVRFRQFGDDRPGGRSAARRRRAPLLRRLGREALPGHQARPAHSEFLGGSADGGRLAELRRQGGIGAAVPRRQPGRVAGQRVRRFGAQHRQSTRRRRRESRPMSPAPRPWSPTSSRWAATAP